MVGTRPCSDRLHFSSLVLLFSALSLILLSLTAAMAEVEESAVHIVYTERPGEEEEPEAYHIRTLASVLGSEDAARGALLYSYRTAASGFSAKLTPKQVIEISKLPGVLQVVPSRTLKLHSGSGIHHM